MIRKTKRNSLKRMVANMDLLDIIRYAMVIILIIYIGIVLSQKGSSSVPFKTVAKNLEKAVDKKIMKKANGQDLKRYYGLNEKDYEHVLLYIPSETMEVSELLLVQAKDSNQAEEIESAVEKRIQTQHDNFEGYGVSQTKQIQEAIVETRGNYVFFTISPKAEKIQKTFEEGL